jgi:hypothetical protein
MTRAQYRGTYPVLNPRPTDLDSRSDALIEGLAGAGIPGEVQPFPLTAAACTALGWAAPTALWANIPAAGNWTDSVSAFALADLNAPLRNRPVNGVVGFTNLWSTLAVEVGSLTNQGMVAANAGVLDIALEDFTIAMGVRTRPVWPGAAGEPAFLCKRKIAAAFNGYTLHTNVAATTLTLGTYDGGAGSSNNFANCIAWDGATHLVSVMAQRGVSATAQFDANAPVVSAVSPAAGSLTNAQKFTILNYAEAGYSRAPNAELMWLYVCIGTASLGGHANMWKHMQAAGLGLPNTYTRATPMVVPISATQTACSAAGQVAVGYSVGAVAPNRGNALGLGELFENTTAFKSITSNNMPGYSAGGATVSAVDGVNSMRSGVQVLMGGAWNPTTNCAYSPTPYANIAAPSNDNWVYSGWVQRATVGTSGRAAWGIFTGGVTEYITFWSEAAVPVAWTYISGTFATTQAGNALGALALGAAANTENCRFSDWAIVKGTTVVPLAYRYTDNSAVDMTMNCPVELIDNTAGNRFDPAAGTIDLILAGFAGAYSVAVPADVLHCVPTAGDAGRLYWRFLSTGFVEIRAYDSAGAVAWAMTTALVPDGNRHHYRLSWNCAASIYQVGGLNYYALLEELTAAHPEGEVLDYAGVAAYATPVATSVPNVYVGSNAGTMAARCAISLVDLR